MKERIESDSENETPKRKPLSVIVHSLTERFHKLLDRVMGNPDDISALDFVGTGRIPKGDQGWSVWEHRPGQGTHYLRTNRYGSSKWTR